MHQININSVVNNTIKEVELYRVWEDSSHRYEKIIITYKTKSNVRIVNRKKKKMRRPDRKRERCTERESSGPRPAYHSHLKSCFRNNKVLIETNKTRIDFTRRINEGSGEGDADQREFTISSVT